ncbi:MAG: hypothetical protein BYD32DRAFT_402086 [Podila humilis]|nr:MAG: hypothetical protein BYD32DRAFT_402086 [Podila humilis]
MVPMMICLCLCLLTAMLCLINPFKLDVFQCCMATSGSPLTIDDSSMKTHRTRSVSIIVALIVVHVNGTCLYYVSNSSLS